MSRILLAVADDQKATRFAAGVMKRLWQAAAADHCFPAVADWTGGLRELRQEFDGGTGPFPRG